VIQARPGVARASLAAALVARCRPGALPRPLRTAPPALRGACRPAPPRGATRRSLRRTRCCARQRAWRQLLRLRLPRLPRHRTAHRTARRRGPAACCASARCRRDLPLLSWQPRKLLRPPFRPPSPPRCRACAARRRCAPEPTAPTVPAMCRPPHWPRSHSALPLVMTLLLRPPASAACRLLRPPATVPSARRGRGGSTPPPSPPPRRTALTEEEGRHRGALAARTSPARSG
jgi:hypothetical protein